jgi:D-xylose 1-dehydrogenase (NADP+, D-xylono-1,5-lactone-forming)
VATVRWGILSTANINEKWLTGAWSAPGAEVVAVASRDGDRADGYARERSIPHAHGGYETLLANPDVDAVYIPLPNSLHVEWTRKALEAGKHVLCEKPLSRHPGEVAELFDLAEARGLQLMEAFMYRHHPQTARLQELVADGAIGTMRMIRAAFSFPIARADDVRLSAALDGGGLMDVGCYCVNAARMLAGEPERVHAERTVGGDGVDITFAGVMRFADGVLAHFDAGVVLTDRSQLEVVGDRGALLVSDPWHCREPGIVWRRDGEIREVEVEIERANSYRLEVENMSAAIGGAARPLLGREDAVGQARAIEALLAAAEGHG